MPAVSSVVRTHPLARTRVPPRFAPLWRALGIPSDYSHRRGLPLQREGARLVSIGRAADDGKPLRLTPRAAAAWRRMHAAATRDRRF